MGNKKVELTELGKRIKALRKAKGYSQTQLAHLVDKDQQSIQRLEAGNINPSYIYLLEIAKGLDIDLSELIKF
jgi:transcriptional regulator with XRE-family HTH domain